MPTANQELAARRYEKRFRDMLQTVFGKLSYFGDFFAGGLEALDGVQNNAIAFSVKTSDIPVVVGTYDTGANVAFGSGTSNSNRFGPRSEIIYVDTDVPYTWGWSIHEGIDRFTVNNVPDAAVADRLELHARMKTQLFNEHHSAFIANSAGQTETLPDYTDASVAKLFDDLSAYFVNIEAFGQKVVKVNTSLYNALVKLGLTVREKGSTVNIDGNNLPLYKDFAIQTIPDALLTDGTDTFAAYSYITGIGKAFTGVVTTRTIQSEDFDGVALQGAGKAGEFMLDDNKKAVVKVVATP